MGGDLLDGSSHECSELRFCVLAVRISCGAGSPPRTVPSDSCEPRPPHCMLWGTSGIPGDARKGFRPGPERRHWMEASTTEIKRHVDLLDDFLDAWNKHDADRIMALCTEDTVWRVPSMPVFAGKAAARAGLDSLLRAFPDMHFEYTIHTTGREPRAASEWHLTATMEARLDPPGFAATGKPIDLEGACLYAFEGGLISRHDIVYDGLELARQMKALPRSDRMAVLMQRLMVKLPVGK